MEKIKRLNWYQKSVLVVMIAMALVFAVIYSMTISKVGFEYKDAIFVPSQENGSTVYSGRLRGQKAYFSVSQDKTVVFHYGNKIYGPYTVKEDNTAIPEEEKTLEGIVGVELRQGRLTGKLQEDIPPDSYNNCSVCNLSNRITVK